MEEDPVGQVSVRFLGEDGNELGGAGILLPTSVTSVQLQILCNQLLENGDDPVPISFFTDNGVEIKDSIQNSIEKLDFEKTLNLIYQPQAVFRVRPVTRCSASIPGHSEAVISAQFSPDGRGLASGSGDTTVRIWDTNTELPQFTCKGHKNWVLCIAWSPDGNRIASACKNGQIMIWNAETGTQIGKTMTRHKQWVTHLAWQPLHKDPQCRFLASAGKDGNIFIWDTTSGNVARALTGHTACVTSIRWGGEGLLYSGSQDRTVKVWRTEDGVMCRTLSGHAHWINTLALNTDYALRTSCFEPKNGCERPKSVEEAQKLALKRYQDTIKICSGEKLVSGSDDFTMFLWNPAETKTSIARMTGHQQLVNQVVFSPDTRYIASASFDKSVKLWCGRTGKYLTSLRGHVNAVYQVAWSADSRLLVSGSADSTLKVWDMKSKHLYVDLPGHGDEVYTVDWSPEVFYLIYILVNLLHVFDLNNVHGFSYQRMLEMASVRVAVLTISDSAVAGTRPDLSGPALTGLLSKSEKYIVETGLVEDDQRVISTKLVEMSSRNNVVITTGGTGFSPRDVTPEATLSIIEKRCTGLEVALHTRSLQATPMAALSRAVAGIRGNCLIVNMPGSPKAVKECWEVLEPILMHAVNLLRDTDDGNVHKKMQS